MRYSICFVGACLVAAGHALPAACPAVRPVTVTSVVWVDPTSTASTSVSASETSLSIKETASSTATSAASTASVSDDVSSSTSTAPAVSSPYSSSGQPTLSTIFTTSVASSSSSSSTPSAEPSPSSSPSSSAEATSSSTTSSAPETSAPAETSAPEVSSTSMSSTSTSSSAAVPVPTTPSSTSAAPTALPSLFRAYPADVVDKLRDASFPKLEQFSAKNVAAGGCTLQNVAIRREWSDLTVPQREEYTTAIRCLMTKPSKLSASVAPGAKSRYDDFVVTHIQQTPNIHNTANFLAWHRYYTWAYEQALRDECGYTGYQPYWNWDRYAADPANSPLFNGNASSIGGNSPSQGACVTTGPFADMKVNVGPGTSVQYNPRCIKRSISKAEAQHTTADKIIAVINNNKNILNFQNNVQSVPGIHTGGHFTVGGDPGGDIYSSPGDVYFFLHHAMIDRVWWIWQMQDLETRLTSVAGSTGAFGNGGPAGTLNDNLNLGVNGGNVKLGALLNTLGGKSGDFCYIYY